MFKKIALIILLIGLGANTWNLSVYGSNYNKTINQKLTKDKLQVNDFKIGGLYINQPIEEVKGILGSPINILSIPNKDGHHKFDEENYYFSGVIINVMKSKQKVEKIRIESKSFKTYRGIGIGDHERDVYYYYGMTKKYEDLITYQMFVDYATSDAQYILDFYVQNNRVSAIEIYIYYPD